MSTTSTLAVAGRRWVKRTREKRAREGEREREREGERERGREREKREATEAAPWRSSVRTKRPCLGC